MDIFKFFRKKEKFPTALFVTASLSAAALLMLLFVFSRIILPAWDKTLADNSRTIIYHDDSGAESADALVTKVPGLKDVLRGPIISNRDPSLGKTDSPIRLVVFSDFECHYCQEQEKILKEAMDKYNLRLIWKDYPRTQENSLSFRSAVAARCAAEQDKFWEYHDLLFAEDKLDLNFLDKAAETLRLDMKKFKDCRTAGKAAQLVRDNIEEADALNITGIPFMYINETEIMGAASLDELSEIIKKKSK